MVNKRTKTPIERLVLHAGAAAGLSFEQVNELLASVNLPPVPASSWRIVLHAYSPWVREDIHALAELTFKPPPWSEIRKRRGLDGTTDVSDEEAQSLH